MIAIAIFAGYTMVQNTFQDSNREQLVDKILKVYQSALQYRKTHGSFGGGSGTYKGWKIPDKLKKTEAGNISFTSGMNYIVLIAEGNTKGWDGNNVTRVWVRFHDRNGNTIRFAN
ncbi:MAG: hypothetical protein V1720_14000 [bacterium]